MKHLKTYEGLFDFLKKKKDYDLKPDLKPDFKASIDYIFDCLFYILDERKIVTSLYSGKREDFGIYTGPGEIIKTGFWEDSIYDYNFWRTNHDIMFVMKYSPEIISDSEVSEIMSDVTAHLAGADCKISYWMACGYDEGGSFDKEFNDFDSMISNTVMKKYSKIDTSNWERHITVKITSEKVLPSDQYNEA
jgi:hypothetical protein